MINFLLSYLGWQLFYGNDMLKLLEIRGFDTSDPAVRDLVLGAESAMWTEQADTEVRIWPLHFFLLLIGVSLFFIVCRGQDLPPDCGPGREAVEQPRGELVRACLVRDT